MKQVRETQAKVIVNPVAGSRSVGREWLRIADQLRRLGISFDHEITEYSGHAMEIARRSAEDGYSCLIVVGGDGTVSEAANGILCSTRSSAIALGIVSVGTAHAFASSLGIGQDYADAFSNLTGQNRTLIDVGVVRCWHEGKPVERFFVNEASVGFPASVVDAWRYLPPRLGRRSNLLLRTVVGYMSLVKHRNKTLSLRKGNVVESIRCASLVMANGRYFADGMQMAPSASLDDGLLDVVIFGDMTRWELLKVKPAIYRGSHIKHSKVTVQKTTAISIESEDQFYVEADGDIIGNGPASFWVIPNALRVMA